MKLFNNYIYNNPIFKDAVQFFKEEAKTDYYHIQSIAFFALEKGASYLGSNDQKKYYRARKKESTMRIMEIWNRKKYGDRILFTTRNIADREVLKSQDDLQKSKEMVKQLKDLQSEHYTTQNHLDDQLSTIWHRHSENQKQIEDKRKKLSEGKYYLAEWTQLQKEMKTGSQTLYNELNELIKGMNENQQILINEELELNDKLIKDKIDYDELEQQKLFKQVEIEDNPEHYLSDGICFGICEFASREFLEGKQAGEIKASLQEKSAEAAANQAVYQLIKPDKTYNQVLQEMVKQLKVSNEFDDIDLDGVLFAFAKKLNGLFETTEETLLNQNPYETDKDRVIPNRFLPLYITVLDEAPDLKPREKALFDALWQFSEGLKKHKDMKSSESVPEKIVNPLWKRLIIYAKKLFGDSKTQETGKPPLQEIAFNSIPDDKLKYQFKEIYQFCRLSTKKNLIALLNNCQSKELTQIFGLPGKFSNDNKFLEKYDDLETGTYMLELSTKKSKHAILIKKESYQKAYILDPNIGMFECSRENPPIETLKEIVNGYSSPPNLHPDAKPGEVNHKLVLVKVEKSN